MTNTPRAAYAGSASLYLKEREELAAVFRRLRREADLTGHELAKQVGFSQSKISKIENARLLPSIDDVVELAKALGAPEDVTASLIERVENLLTEFNSWRMLHRPGLQAKQEQFLELEAQSRRICIFQQALVPGLLQTPEYARRILMKADSSGRGDIDAAVATRMNRQMVLYDHEKTFRIVVTEGALRARYGSADAMAIQIERIQSLSNLPNVDLRMIPLETELPRIPLNSFCIFDEAVVTAETYSAEMDIRGHRDIALYVDVFGALYEAAEPEDETRQRLFLLAHDLRNPATREGVLA